jgi:peroxiredoxin Q/BCP
MPKQTIKIGAKAPSFALADQTGKRISLKDLAGRWTVLYFYPKDDTPGCTKEACEFTSHLKQFEKLDARVIGVSPDSPESHQKFIRKHDLKVDLLSDPDRKALARYGAWGEKSMYGRKYEGVLRSTVLIDPIGRIAYHWAKVTPAGHAEEVRAKLAELTSS